jgi:antitoxin (DNA-binding transcriptional repressor) of toxin-antitoxin stability system
MRIFDPAEAKKQLSELVKCAERGETIGIRLRGEVAALIEPPCQPGELRKAFGDLEQIRKHVRGKKGITNRKLIEEGRK